MSKRYKYKLFTKRRDILNYDKTLFNYWRYARRNNKLHENDGYYLLLYGYFEKMKLEYRKLYDGHIWHFYRDYTYQLDFFTVKLPNTRETLSEDYLDNISMFSFEYHGHTNTYYMHTSLLKSPDNHSIFLIYYPSTDVLDPDEIRELKYKPAQINYNI